MSYAFINNTKHFAVATSAQLVQDALNNETMGNPYVAIVNGDLDYNSLEPEECYIGEWSDDGEGEYTFHITDAKSSLWTQVKIGELLGVYSQGNHNDLDVILTYDQDAGTWHMELFSEIASDTPEYDFEQDGPYVWETDAMTDPNDSDAVIRVSWDGTDTFVFFTASDPYPLSMTTINIDCPDSDKM